MNSNYLKYDKVKGSIRVKAVRAYAYYNNEADRGNKMWTSFANFLGFATYGVLQDRHIKGDADLDKLLRLIAGPHGHTVLKMLKHRSPSKTVI